MSTTDAAVPDRGWARFGSWNGLRTGRLSVCIALWALCAILSLLWIRWRGDVDPPAAVILLAPRWPWLIPSCVLLGVAAARRRPDAVALTATLLLLQVAFFIDLRLWGWVPSVARRPAGEVVRVMTFNRSDFGFDTAGLQQLIEREQLDLICFQERGFERILRPMFVEGWWWSGDGRILSRFPIVEEWPRLEDLVGGPGMYSPWLTRVRVRLRSGRSIVVASVHLPTFRPAFEALARGDWSHSVAHLAWCRGQMERVLLALDSGREVPVIVGGDLNVPDDAPMLARTWTVWRNGFNDVGLGWGFTRPSDLPWTRIDHILASRHWNFRWCRVGPHLASDHLPVLAELGLTEYPPSAAPEATRVGDSPDH